MKSTNRGVSHYLCAPEMTVLAFFDSAVVAGFQSVGLTISALEEMPIKTLRSELISRELEVSSINTAGYFFSKDQGFANQSMINQRLLQAAAELNPVNGVNLIVGGSSDMNLSDARDFAIEQSAVLAAQAKRLGTRLLLEPMHPLQARSKGCVNTLKQAGEWLKHIPELTLNVDLFHSWWDPDLEAALRGDFGEIAVLQVCDVVIDQATNIPYRAPLGEGFLDWQSPVQQMLKGFPGAPVELELFAQQMPGRDSLSVMVQGAQQMKKILKDEQ
jgi:sugar phosphate isomerase/epimerase